MVCSNIFIKNNIDNFGQSFYLEHINIIKNVTRLKFISLLPHYMKGTFLNVSNIDKYITSEKCKEIVVSPAGGHMRLCVDGEIIDAGQTRFEII